MDFHPDHEKWQCCCCRIPTGLKIMGIIEAICGIGVMAIALKMVNQQTQTAFFAFYLCMAVIAFLIAISSLLMVIGVRRRKHKWLLPSVAARVLLVIFVTVFGVSIGVVQHDDPGGETAPTKPPKRGAARVKLSGRKVVNQEEPNTALRLVFLIFLMLIVSVAVFYTVFLVVKGINYIKSYNRLKRRRSSFMAVAQLDPNLMAPKRPSQCSYNLMEQQQQLFLADYQQQQLQNESEMTAEQQQQMAMEQQQQQMQQQMQQPYPHHPHAYAYISG